MPKTSVCLKVPKQNGETSIALASKLGLIDKTLAIQRDKENLCIPLVRQPEEKELLSLKNQIPEMQLASSTFNEKKTATQTVMQVLNGKLPPHLLASLPQALDVIGDIAILEIPPELKPHEPLIGQAILQTHKNVKTVLAKAGAISGTYRTREFTFIAGEQKTQTIHKEFGCQYHVDVAKAYFSPRLSHEHERVASLVQSSETVVDLFAGVGPFSVLIAKKNPNVKVYAVDLNPEAVELLKVNVRLNRVDNRVFPIQADAKQIAKGKLNGVADRVIMNLPETAIDFVSSACQIIKPQGGVIHFYGFVRKPDTIAEMKLRFSNAVRETERKVTEFLYAKSIRETAPYESQVVLDAKIQ
jgi:tRNA (guanine37-N1)-methyltransferase